MAMDPTKAPPGLAERDIWEKPNEKSHDFMNYHHGVIRRVPSVLMTLPPGTLIDF